MIFRASAYWKTYFFIEKNQRPKINKTLRHASGSNKLPGNRQARFRPQYLKLRAKLDLRANSYLLPQKKHHLKLKKQQVLHFHLQENARAKIRRKSNNYLSQAQIFEGNEVWARSSILHTKYRCAYNELKAKKVFVMGAQVNEKTVWMIRQTTARVCIMFLWYAQM